MYPSASRAITEGGASYAPLPPIYNGGRGGTGIHTGFGSQRPPGHAGSNPADRTDGIRPANPVTRMWNIGFRITIATRRSVMDDEKDRKHPGPDPETLKIEGDWEDAVRKALRKPPPAKRPPPPSKKTRRKK